MVQVPVIDLFAGPGGLGEGFSAFEHCDGVRPFRIKLSVEKDTKAHETLKLRGFFRQFPKGQAPDAYYSLLRGDISYEELFKLYPKEAKAAEREALHRELGKAGDNKVIDTRISAVLKKAGTGPWVLIGGPPCQAYSTVGRSRRIKEPRKEFDKDERHYLYRQYLRIIAKFEPTVFVMENVKGILSSKVRGKGIFQQILQDLKNPIQAANSNGRRHSDDRTLSYRIYSLAVPAEDPDTLRPSDFIIKSEDYGIPQTRHRVILLGIRDDVHAKPGRLQKTKRVVPCHRVIADLPRLRSALSREEDSAKAWREAVMSIVQQEWFAGIEDDELIGELMRSASRLGIRLNHGTEFRKCESKPSYRPDWYCDDRLGGVCNHTARTHMREDLFRYLFASCFAKVRGVSPMMRDFPEKLWPAHRNVQEAVNGDKFDDRFRVQIKGNPATTITCHIAKDGHYYIHYDPTQCRSLTVREAARIQTFPDNYFFAGDRTPQYRQVGNAVPPLLAIQIASVVHGVIQDNDRKAKDDGHSEQREEKLEHVTHPLEEHRGGDNRKVDAAPDRLPLPHPPGEPAGKA